MPGRASPMPQVREKVFWTGLEGREGTGFFVRLTAFVKLREPAATVKGRVFRKRVVLALHLWSEKSSPGFLEVMVSEIW